MKRATLLFFFCLVCIFGARWNQAHAISKSYTESCTIGLERTDWNKTCSLKKFSEDAGTLTKVKLEFTGYVEGVIKLENKDSESKTITANYTNTLKLSDASNDKLLENPIKLSFTESLPDYDGTTDYDGDSGRTSATLKNEESDTVTLESSDALSQYSGSGSVQLPVSATGGMSVEGGSNASVDWDTYARAEVVATYIYEAHDLSLRKTHQGERFKPGDTVAFTLTVKNEDGRSFDDQISITDSLPAGLTYQGFEGSGWSCSANGREISCSSDTDLGAGDSTSVVITVRIDDGVNGTRTNVAKVSAKGDGNPDNNTATDWVVVGENTPAPTPQTPAQPIETPVEQCTVADNPQPPCTPDIASVRVTQTEATLSVQPCDNPEGCGEFLVVYGTNAEELDQEQRFSVPENPDGNITLVISDLLVDTPYYFAVRCTNACFDGTLSSVIGAVTNPPADKCPKIYTDTLQTPEKDYEDENCERDAAVLGASTDQQCTVVKQETNKQKWGGIGAGIASLFWVLVGALVYFFLFRKKDEEQQQRPPARRRRRPAGAAMTRRRRTQRSYSEETL